MQTKRSIALCFVLMLPALFCTLPLNADTPRRSEVSQAYVPLMAESAEVFSKLGKEAIDDPASGRVPNYLRALATFSPNSVSSFAHLFKTALYGGTVAPETKALMGIAVAKENGSEYLIAHLKRLLRASEKGRKLLLSLGNVKSLEEGERIAVRYAIDLTRAVHGVSDTEFAQARGVYNDAQLVELTAITCYFNYFARFCQGAGLPLEAWAKEPANGSPASNRDMDDVSPIPSPKNRGFVTRKRAYGVPLK